MDEEEMNPGPSNNKGLEGPYSQQLYWDKELKWKPYPESIEPSNQDPVDKQIQAALKDHLQNTQPSCNGDWLTKNFYPTDGELGALASLVYKEDAGYTQLSDLNQCDKIYIDLGINNWELVGIASHDGTTNGYVGALYWHPEHKHLVIAHRGTDPGNLGALYTDICGIYGGKYVDQISSAVTFSHAVLLSLEALFIDKSQIPSLSFTGHSLGGWLAHVTTFTAEYLEYLDVHFRKRKLDQGGFPYHPHAVAWDSPGCHPMLYRLKTDFEVRYNDAGAPSNINLEALDIRGYLSGPNQINTCNPHTGVIYRLFPNSDTEPKTEHSLVGGLVKKAGLDRLANWFTYTKTSHNLDALLIAYDKRNEAKHPVKKVIDWPIRHRILGGSEYSNFFKVAEWHNNPDVAISMPENIISMQEALIVRYRVENLDVGKTDMRIFSTEERQFLAWMKALQKWVEKERKDFSALTKLGDFLNQLNKETHVIDIDVLKHSFENYTLEENSRALIAQNRAQSVDHVINITKNIIKKHPEIVQIAKLEIEGFPTLFEVVYENESDRLIRQVQDEVILRFNTGRDFLGLVKFLNDSQANVLHIKSESYAEAVMFEQLGIDTLSNMYSRGSDFDFSGERSSDIDLNPVSMEKAVTFLSVSMIRLQAGKSDEFSFQNFCQSTTSPLVWLDVWSGFIKSDKSWLKDLFENSLGKKFVILTRNEDTIFERIKSQFCEKVDSYTEGTKFMEWSQLTFDSRQKLLDYEINFQGNPTVLKQLVANPAKMIDSLTLTAFLNRREVKIGNKLSISSSYDEVYYIERTINRLTISNEVFSKEGFVDIVTDCEQEFRELCLGNSKKHVHCLSRESGSTSHSYLQQSRGSLKNIRNYIGPAVAYPPNKLGQFLEEAEQQKIILISDSSGMGKTTLLTHISKAIQNKFRTHWVLKVDLNDHYKSFKSLKLENSSKPCIENPIGFLSEKVLNLRDPFEQKVFEHSLESDGPVKIVLLFDGFDEISPTYKEQALQLFKELQKTYVKQIWVTTRPHLKEDLEEELQRLSFTLERFSKDDQTNFLIKYWSKNLGNEVPQSLLKVFAEKLISKLSKSIEDRNMAFTGIPLQTRLLAEAFLNEIEQVGGVSNEEAIEKFEIPVQLNLLDLYDRFIYQKYIIYRKEKGKADLDSPYEEERMELNIQNFKKEHYKSALLEILGEKEKTRLQSQLDVLDNPIALFSDDDKQLARGGIFQCSNGNRHFIHRSFAEYFVSNFLMTHLTGKNVDKIVLEFLLTIVLVRPEYIVVRAFLNSQLKKCVGQEQAGQGTAEQGKVWLKPNFSDKILIKVGELFAKFWQEKNKAGYKAFTDWNWDEYTIMHILAKNGNTDILNFINWSLKTSSSNTTILQEIGGKSYDEKTPLCIAVKGGHLGTVKYLVEEFKCDINFEDKFCDTPMHIAIRNNNLDMVKYLVSLGANKNSRSSEGYTVLQASIVFADISMVKFLVQEGSDMNTKLLNGNTLLHVATRNGKLEMVEFLLDKGFSIDATNEEDSTPLHLAARNGKIEVVEFLVNKQAKLNILNKELDTPLNAAVQGNKFEIVKRLISFGADLDKNESLHKAAECGHVEIFSYLVDIGAEIEFKRIFGQSTLHIAAFHGKLNIVELLVSLLPKNAKIDEKDEYGHTPLTNAVARRHLKVAEFLIRNRADVNIRCAHGVTPLHYAVKACYLEMLKLLVNNGAKTDATDDNGNTLLHFIFYNDCLEMSRCLWKQGVPRVQRNEKLEILEFLIEQTDLRASIDAKNQNEQTPLHWAVMWGDLNVVNCLLRNGANTNAKDTKGLNALDLAFKESKHEVVKLFEYILKKYNQQFVLP